MNNEINKLDKLNESKLNAQKNELKELSKTFLSQKQSGLYNYIKNIEKNDILYYIFLFSIIFYSLKYLNFNTRYFFISVVAIVIIYYINDMKNTNSLSRMKELQIKLYAIDPLPKYFYIDSGFIELIHSIKEFKTYSPVLFEKIIIQIDHFLKLVLLMEKFPNDSYYLLDSLHKKKKSILNILHSFIYNIPSSVATEVKLDNALNSMHFMLNYHFEKLRTDYNHIYEKNIPNINSKYYYSSKHPDGNDELITDNYNIY